jgi:hypothetical protein
MLVLPLLFSAASAIAQAPESTIRESTDPARAAEVERRAQELRSGQTQSGTSSSSRMQQDMSDRRGAARGEGYRNHEGKRGHHGTMRRGHASGGHPRAVPDAGGSTK